MHVGSYVLHLYCDHPDHGEQDFSRPVEIVRETGAACRKLARARGWVLHRDFSATCPNCRKTQDVGVKH